MVETVDVVIEAQIAVVRFSNPPDGYMTDETSIGLLAALDQIDANDAIRAVILTGANDGVFIRHFDVRILESRGRDLREKGVTFTLDRLVPEAPLHTALRRIERSPLPFIAALNGTAMGGGFEIALACDIRLAQEGDYWIGLPEVNIGLLPGAGGTQRLPAVIGQARALEFILTGATVTPVRAAELGLVSRAVNAPVLAHARALAGSLAAKPQKALAHVKHLMRGNGSLDAERTLFCDLMVSDEAIDLMSAMNAGGDIRNPVEPNND